MIHKRIKFGNVDDVTVVEFGRGTVGGVTYEEGDGSKKSVLLRTMEPSKIGVFPLDADTQLNSFRPEVALVFYNEESLDVVLNAMMEIKRRFSGEHTPECVDDSGESMLEYVNTTRSEKGLRVFSTTMAKTDNDQ